MTGASFEVVHKRNHVRVASTSTDEAVKDMGSVSVRKSSRIGAHKLVPEEKVEDWEMSSLSELLGRERLSQRLRIDHKKVNLASKRKMGSISEVLEREQSVRAKIPIVEERRRSCSEKSIKDNSKPGKSGLVKELRVEKLQISDKRKRRGVLEEEVEMSKNYERKRDRIGESDEMESMRSEDGEEVEELTLAEMKIKASRKSKGRKDTGKRILATGEEVEDEEEVVLNNKRRIFADSEDLEVMTVEDSDFYDFDKDRVERGFKKGQVWAIYDDDDGMPRHYGLIDEVISVNPFAVKMSWLNFQNDGDERLACWEKRGFHVSCGKFKVARKDDVELLNIFSHLVECERVARELYLTYPRKDSIWALYNERALDSEARNSSCTDERCYAIVLFLTSYSEVYGLSMVYLKKVDGYRAVFTRREIGYNAVRWIEKIDITLFSHQIPARKLSRDESPQFLGDCWELDPASLPQNLLAVT